MSATRKQQKMKKGEGHGKVSDSQRAVREPEAARKICGK